MSAPQFDPAFLEQFETLLAWRRDVRRFTTRAVDPQLLDTLLDLACLAPSVGNSQPWRFISVESTHLRQGVRDSFLSANEKAAAIYTTERKELYNHLKLEGLQQAPVQLAICCDMATDQGHGLGQQTMPETLLYSTVCAIHTLWLVARTRGLGVGWVSILEPAHVASLLNIPESWQLVAYLCIGYPQEESVTPELAKAGWQDRNMLCRVLHVR